MRGSRGHPSLDVEVRVLWLPDSYEIDPHEGFPTPPCSTPGLPELDQGDVPTFDYPTSMRLQQLLCCVGSIPLLLAVLFFAIRCAASAFFRLPFPFQVMADGATSHHTYLCEQENGYVARGTLWSNLLASWLARRALRTPPLQNLIDVLPACVGDGGLNPIFAQCRLLRLKHRGGGP